MCNLIVAVKGERWVKFALQNDEYMQRAILNDGIGAMLRRLGVPESSIAPNQGIG